MIPGWYSLRTNWTSVLWSSLCSHCFTFYPEFRSLERIVLSKLLRLSTWPFSLHVLLWRKNVITMYCKHSGKCTETEFSYDMPERKYRFFEFIKRTVPSTLNVSLDTCSSNAHGYGLMTDFLGTGNSGRLYGIFYQNGRHEMLETPYFDDTDSVFFFLGALRDTFFGLRRPVKATSTSAKIVDLLSFFVQEPQNL